MTAPFGIEVGTPITSLEVLDDLGSGKYFVSAPKPHPQFVSYVVQASPTYGVVWIKGIGPEIDNDGYGHGVRAAAERLATQLAARYGKGTVQDWTDPEGIWTDTKDWVIGLLNGERHYFHVWDRSGQANLPDDLTSIFVGVNATSSYSANVILEYSSSNLEAAEAELDSDLADLL